MMQLLSVLKEVRIYTSCPYTFIEKAKPIVTRSEEAMGLVGCYIDSSYSFSLRYIVFASGAYYGQNYISQGIILWELHQ